MPARSHRYIFSRQKSQFGTEQKTAVGENGPNAHLNGARAIRTRFILASFALAEDEAAVEAKSESSRELVADLRSVDRGDERSSLATPFPPGRGGDGRPGTVPGGPRGGGGWGPRPGPGPGPHPGPHPGPGPFPPPPPPSPGPGSYLCEGTYTGNFNNGVPGTVTIQGKRIAIGVNGQWVYNGYVNCNQYDYDEANFSYEAEQGYRGQGVIRVYNGRPALQTEMTSGLAFTGYRYY